MRGRYAFLLFFFAVGVAGMALPHTASATVSPIAWWKFDDGSGTAPVDSSGNSITGAFSGTTQPTWSTDVPSVSFSDPYSLSFTGNGDGVLFNWPSGLNMNSTASRSFSFWFKPTADGEPSGGYSRLVSWTGDAFEIAGSDGDSTNHKLSFYDGNSWRSTNYSMSLNTWYQVTFTFENGSEYLYIGGVQQFSASTTNNALSGVIGIGTRINNTPHNEGVNGLIDDVRVYNVALTGTQISNLTSGSSDPDTPPDTTAPTHSAIASSTSSTGATITWTTDEAASSKVAYSIDTSYASSTTETDTSSRVTSHSKSLTSLLSCTWYNFKVVSADAAGNYATSTNKAFLTSNCPGGATPSSLASTTVTVSTAATSTLTDTGRTLTVATPANFTATSSSVVIQIKGMSADTVLGSIGRPSGLSSAASIVFDVSALINNVTTLDSFSTPVTMTYNYTDADVSGLNESSLTMYHYHNGSWLALDSCTVNTSANTITCTAPSFSTFAIFGSSSSSSSSSSSTSGGGTLPWCSGPLAPGWNASLPDGGCGLKQNPVAVSTPSAPGTKCPAYSFTRPLRFGMKGEDVRALQKLLNCLGFTLAAEGPGSSGKETNVFLDKTRTSLIYFQETYKKEVLKPINATKGTGIFGENSRAKMMKLVTDLN